MTWGFGGKGQLGHGDTTRHLVPKLVAGLEGAKKMACGYYHNLVATSDTVYSWGKSDRGQLGHGSTTMALVPTAVEALSGKGIEHLDCGDYNSMVATESGEVYMWGRGQEGQMGNGMGEDVLSPIQHPAFNGNSLITLSLGWGHGAAITKQPLDVARLSHNPKQDSREEAGDTDDSMQISGILPALMPHSSKGTEGAKGAVKEFAEEYKDMMHVEETTEAHLGQLDQVMEGLLGRLDEYGAVLDTTKVDTARTWNVMLPRLISNAQDMEATFAVIDELEGYVNQVGEGMRKLEHRVDATEEAVTGGASVQSKAMSFFGLKASSSRDPILDLPVDIPKAGPLFDRLHQQGRAQAQPGSGKKP